jgi:hypothetical protein
MSKPPERAIHLTDKLNLCWYPATNGAHGWWLWDETRGMNLAMRAKTEQDAFVEALEYYQERLLKVEQEHKDLRKAVEAFVEQVTEQED